MTVLRAWKPMVALSSPVIKILHIQTSSDGAIYEIGDS